MTPLARSFLGMLAVTVVAAALAGWLGVSYGLNQRAPELDQILRRELNLTAEQQQKIAPIEKSLIANRHRLRPLQVAGHGGSKNILAVKDSRVAVVDNVVSPDDAVPGTLQPIDAENFLVVVSCGGDAKGDLSTGILGRRKEFREIYGRRIEALDGNFVAGKWLARTWIY